MPDSSTIDPKKIKTEVKEYYGETLKTSEDLQTDACCTDTQLSPQIKEALKLVHPETLAKYYGCGLITPQKLKGTKILDLGCGAGRDVFALAYLVGETGQVTGIDMTPNQLNSAIAKEDYHKDKFGYNHKNTRFIEGQLENLLELGLEPNSFDIIVSNCVINLVPNKEAVFKAAKHLLKPGGEIYFSDIYCDRRIPIELTQDPVLYGECLSGAMYINDFENTVKRLGFQDPRIVEGRELSISNPSIETKVKGYKFYSITYRLFNLDNLEPHCEDYGQSVTYKGNIEGHEKFFELDSHHKIESGKPFKVCGNTYNMLAQTRFKENFDFTGDFSTHFGIFPDCGNPTDSIKSLGNSCDTSPFSSGCC